MDRHVFLNLFIGLALLCMTAGCSARPNVDILRPVELKPRFTPKVDMMVATMRVVGDPENPFAESSDRAKQLNYGTHSLSILTHHKVGQIEWPDQIPPDPSRHFMTTNRSMLDRSGFLNTLRKRAAHNDRGRVLVFVHGFNMRYQEAVYWLGQISHDSGFQGTPILFAWPSRGVAPLYVADRESTEYSRDYFEQFLLDVAGLPEVREIDILAHSMGSWLTVETLRQASMRGHKRFRGKLREVILASPDIDVNVFRTQLDTIGRLPRPITILVSGDDKALVLSRLLDGGNDRVGLVTAEDPRAVRGARLYDLNIVDLTALDSGDPSNHSKFVRSGAVMAAIGRRLDNHVKQKASGGAVVAAVTDVGQSLVKLPAAIVGAAQ